MVSQKSDLSNRFVLESPSVAKSRNFTRSTTLETLTQSHSERIVERTESGMSSPMSPIPTATLTMLELH